MIKGWKAIAGLALFASQMAEGQDLYQEAFRPQFHFTARQWTYHQANPGQRDEGWLNDANGLVFVAGEWHYFAQRWAHCWIHAVSRDLVHWEELKPAFWEDDAFGPTQSGTIVIDSANVTGLATGRNPLMIAFWSSWNNKDQCVSYSNDLGRTWTKYGKNPVLSHAERDPQVFWHPESRKWVMVLSGPGGYFFFSSDNLLSWKEESFIPGWYECPDMFRLAVDGNAADRKWVLMNGDGSYRVGDFDGRKFTPQTPQRRLDWGGSFYATQSWHDVPASDGRRIQTAWMRTDGNAIYPGMPFNQQTSFPAAMTLRRYADTLRVFRNPVDEIRALHADTQVYQGRTLAAGASMPIDALASPLHVVAWVTLMDGTDGAAEGSFTIRGSTVKFTSRNLSIDGDKGGFALPLTRLKIELLIDRTSIEAFGNEGELSLTNCFRASNGATSLRCDKGSLRLDTLRIHRLSPIWNAKPVQGFSSDLGGAWTSVTGAWKDSATGKMGTGSGDNFQLNDRTGGDFTFAGEVELFTAAGAALVLRADAGAAVGYCVNVDFAGLVKLWAPGRGELARFATPINARQPYHLRVIARGPTLMVYFNHRKDPVITYTDAQPVLSGRFGVNVYGGMGQFQDLRVVDEGPASIAIAKDGRRVRGAADARRGWTLTGRKTPRFAKRTTESANNPRSAH
ncbi:MAG: hypothetical protein JWP91_1175 [Fibrobacteres bacterium]|nr:hypothetical protein [Fibrobacterota bacterium]